ncbi:MAG: PKD domain-containing protein, partial [Acidobacteria bacterium]
MALPGEVWGQACGRNMVATPVPEFRDDNGPSVRLWPDGFRPGLPGQQLPAERDSTSWDSFIFPFAGTGLELFHALDIVGDTLFMVYNSGIQAWDIGGANAESPVRLDKREGLPGFNEWLSFPGFGENDVFLEDIAAIDPTGLGQEYWVSVSGLGGIGPSIWKFANGSFTELYQDVGSTTREVRMAKLGSTVYAFHSSVDGIEVYNVTQAAARSTPCLDNKGSVCPGIYLGVIDGSPRNRYIDALAIGDKAYLAITDAQGSFFFPLSVQIWEMSSSGPVSAALRLDDTSLPSISHAVELFQLGGRNYLAIYAGDAIQIYDVGHCLDNDGCTSLGAPVYTLPTGPLLASHYSLTFSESEGTPFLYFGYDIFSNEGSKIEQLLDLTTLGTTNQITEITDGGGTYTDLCNGSTVDYWGDYYPNNDHGLNAMTPRKGMFNGKYFYRAGLTIFDVHVRENVAPVPAMVQGITGSTSWSVCQTPSFQANGVSGSGVITYAWRILDSSSAEVFAQSGTGMTTFDWPTGGTTPAGNYTVELTVTNDANPTGDTVTLPFTLNTLNPLGFTSPQTYDGAPADPSSSAVQFRVQTTGATQWTWDFGDGSPAQSFTTEAEGENPVHFYSAAGTFNVSVTISNCVEPTPLVSPTTLSVTIDETVIDPLEVLAFDAACPFGICSFSIGENISFTHQVNGNPDTYEYDWQNDGSFEQQSSTPISVHAYGSAGTFHPRLRISRGAEQVTFTSPKPITVVPNSPPPPPPP